MAKCDDLKLGFVRNLFLWGNLKEGIFMVKSWNPQQIGLNLYSLDGYDVWCWKISRCNEFIVLLRTLSLVIELI